MGDVFICDAVRTPIGRFGGSLAEVRTDDLAAAPIKALLAKHPKLDFVTSIGHGEGGDHRARLGVATKGPTKLITDLCVFEPDPETKEMTVVSIHPGVTRDEIDGNTGWKVKYALDVAETPAPNARELATLREIHARTKRAHGDQA